MHSAFKITFIYIVISSLWIITSDRIITLFTDNIEVLTMYSSIKGMIFVLTTSILLFFLISRDNASRNHIIDTLNKVLFVKSQLIKELHHRVKNNIQMILSLVRLEASKNRPTEDLRKTIETRILSMSSVYNIVYNKEDMTDISLSDVLREYQRISPWQISIHVTDTAPITIETIVTLMLIVDHMLERISVNGYKGSVEISTGTQNVIFSFPDQCGTFQELIGNEHQSFDLYIRSIKGKIDWGTATNTQIRIDYSDKIH